MAEISEKIKKNAKEIKNNTYGKNIADKAQGYTTGAIVGGIAGVLSGYFFFKGRMILCTAIGIIGGGYIGYKIVEGSQMQQEFDFSGNKK